MPNRYICAVLDAIRDCDKTKNYSYLLGLVEEAQVLANRMEAALHDRKDLKYDHTKHRELKAQIKKLEAKKKKLNKGKNDDE